MTAGNYIYMECEISLLLYDLTVQLSNYSVTPMIIEVMECKEKKKNNNNIIFVQLNLWESMYP